MLKNDTLRNGTSRIGLYGSAPPRGKRKIENIGILRMTGEVADRFNGRTLFYLDKSN